MRLCVIDLEMNQPSHSIIQIGAVCYDTRQDKVRAVFSSNVRPGDEQISPYITELTGITQEMVDVSMPLDIVAADLSSWASEYGCASVIAAWGRDDHYLRSQIPADRYPWRSQLDIKVMSSVMQSTLPGKARGGLARQLAKLGLEFTGVPHRALDDALNTVYVLREYVNAMRMRNEAVRLLRQNGGDAE
jgi:inhibitor of KinA sporulation pathway (predicted exonuclease)